MSERSGRAGRGRRSRVTGPWLGRALQAFQGGTGTSWGRPQRTRRAGGPGEPSGLPGAGTPSVGASSPAPAERGSAPAPACRPDDHVQSNLQPATFSTFFSLHVFRATVFTRDLGELRGRTARHAARPRAPPPGRGSASPASAAPPRPGPPCGPPWVRGRTTTVKRWPTGHKLH